MPERFKHRLFRILELAESGDVPSKAFDIFILSLIVLNVLAVMLESVEGLAARYGRFFERFEVFSVAVFTVEYVLRVWACCSNWPATPNRFDLWAWWSANAKKSCWSPSSSSWCCWCWLPR